jgi:ABC-2 type transport system permease protein
MLKNMKIYSRKPPVIIFGLLFPSFMFLAFYFGREVDFSLFFPGFAGMSMFFLSSSIGPLITPWEKISKTYERLLTFPITVRTIICGDILTGTIYGMLLSSVVLVPGFLILQYRIAPFLLAVTIIFGALCFSSLGTLLSSPNVPNPSYVMMFSSLIRFPLIFLSGIFIPMERLTGVPRIISYISPLTYVVDLFHHSLRGEGEISIIVDLVVITGFSVLFVVIANHFHKKNMLKGY